MAKKVTKNVKLTIPDSFYLDLKDWAEQEGRTISNLASFVCETAIRQAKADGTYTPSAKRKDMDTEELTTTDNQIDKT